MQTLSRLDELAAVLDPGAFEYLETSGPYDAERIADARQKVLALVEAIREPTAHMMFGKACTDHSIPYGEVWLAMHSEMLK